MLAALRLLPCAADHAGDANGGDDDENDNEGDGEEGAEEQPRRGVNSILCRVQRAVSAVRAGMDHSMWFDRGYGNMAAAQWLQQYGYCTTMLMTHPTWVPPPAPQPPPPAAYSPLTGYAAARAPRRPPPPPPAREPRPLSNYTTPLLNQEFFNATHECLYLVFDIENPIGALESDRRRHGASTRCGRGVEHRPSRLRLARFHVGTGDPVQL